MSQKSITDILWSSQRPINTPKLHWGTKFCKADSSALTWYTCKETPTEHNAALHHQWQMRKWSYGLFISMSFPEPAPNRNSVHACKISEGRHGLQRAQAGDSRSKLLVAGCCLTYQNMSSIWDHAWNQLSGLLKPTSHCKSVYTWYMDMPFNTKTLPISTDPSLDNQRLYGKWNLRSLWN